MAKLVIRKKETIGGYTFVTYSAEGHEGLMKISIFSPQQQKIYDSPFVSKDKIDDEKKKAMEFMRNMTTGKSITKGTVKKAYTPAPLDITIDAKNKVGDEGNNFVIWTVSYTMNGKRIKARYQTKDEAINFANELEKKYKKDTGINKSADILAVYKVLPNGDVRRVQKESVMTPSKIEHLRSVAKELSRMVRKAEDYAAYWRKRGWVFENPPENIDTSKWGENEWRKWIMSHGKNK
jgi:hypothetical protein